MIKRTHLQQYKQLIYQFPIKTHALRTHQFSTAGSGIKNHCKDALYTLKLEYRNRKIGNHNDFH